MTPELENAAAQPAATEGALLAQRHELEDPAEPPLAVALIPEIDYAARVQRGAALLDVKWPTWAQEVDLDTLDIQVGTACMTAQYAQAHGLGKFWWQSLDSLELTAEGGYEDHGFNAERAGVDEEADKAAYGALNRLWRDLITERRAAAQPEASER